MIFSVVIPCYNCVKTLEATVNSIRACGLTDHEILLVDDGASTEHCLARRIRLPGNNRICCCLA